MVLKTFEIPLDIENEIYSPTELLFRVSRNDFESIELQFIISQDNAAFDLTGTTVELAIRKPSGLSVYQLCEITNAVEGKATTRLSIQAYVEQGIHTAEVYIRTGGSMAVTTPFYFSSREAIMQTEEVPSVNDWSALQEALFAYDLKPILSDGFPTEVPEYVGQMAFDIVNNNAYIANDLFATSWQGIGADGGGGGNDTILGETAPTVVPARIGQLYIDTVARAAYVSTGTTAADWEQIDAAAGTATVTWTDVTEKPLTFPPDNHTHNIAAITDLQTTLDGKADDAHSHTFAEITARPATYPPDAHTHDEYQTEAETDARYDRLPSTGTVDPTGAPLYVGQIYINTTSKEAWIANSITGDWQTISQDELGSGGSTVDWGGITGDISLQTDLQNALAGKADDADLTGKSDVGHTHTASNITDFGTAVAGAIPPEYLTQTEGDTRYKAAGSAPEAHTHAISDVTNLPAELDALDKKPIRGAGAPSVVPEYIAQMYLDESTGDAYIANGLTAADWRLITNQQGSESVAWGSITGTLSTQTDLQTALDGKAAATHSHAYIDITEKPATFPPDPHTHTSGNITDFGTAVAGAIPPEYLTQSEGDVRYKAAGTAPEAHTHTEADITFGAKNAKTYVDDADNYIMNTRMSGLTLWRGTQADYDLIATKDPNTLYFIVG